MSIRNILLGLAGISLVSACQGQGTPKAPASSGQPSSPAAVAPAPSASGGDVGAGTVIARWTEGGAEKTLTYGELKDARKQTFTKLDQDRYNTIRRELEGFVVDKLLEAEAQKSGKTAEVYMQELATAVPAEQVKKFYDENVARDGQGPPLDQVESRIRQFVSMRDTVERVKKEAGVKLTLPEPEVPVASFNLSDRPMKGSESAKVTIVEFSDFQCPYCARATQPVEDLLKAFPEQVKVYFLHYPLNFHQQAMPAAIASRCAQQQGKFWEMHDKIFQNQGALSPDDLKGHATALGLDVSKYEACIADPATEGFVKADMKQGNEAGVGGTPSFYVNGKATQGPPSVDQIRALLES